MYAPAQLRDARANGLTLGRACREPAVRLLSCLSEGVPCVRREHLYAPPKMREARARADDWASVSQASSALFVPEEEAELRGRGQVRPARM